MLVVFLLLLASHVTVTLIAPLFTFLVALITPIASTSRSIDAFVKHEFGKLSTMASTITCRTTYDRWKLCSAVDRRRHTTVWRMHSVSRTEGSLKCPVPKPAVH
ncbi:hypothetical protein C8Q74DRAFT_326926 [Fomes fomentarius]|nr:hypothetical protein C8Q74DRAFT_326926 [Fomes fomentarius]